MTATRTYITTTIPYVNARPHLGFALELVQADVLARRARQRGESVRALTGTDDNSLKNVLAAQAEGVPVRELVDRNATAFAALRSPLDLHSTTSSERVAMHGIAAASSGSGSCAMRVATLSQALLGPLLRRLRAVLRT